MYVMAFLGERTSFCEAIPVRQIWKEVEWLPQINGFEREIFNTVI